ncbi:T6SS immunity protein Tli4 family protein [Massilia luteola]|uniref:T6SS immunity protein Tli4 family protein n=1 Tax=Massilia luteola TaxID=3081751 RepID=UPI003CC5BE3C
MDTSWETQGIPDDPKQPFLSLALHGGIGSCPGGTPIDTSLHEGAVLAPWDSISSSIRRRPVKPLENHPPSDKPAAGRRDRT